MIIMKAMTTDGLEVICKFSKLECEDDPYFEATICRIRHGDYCSIMIVDKRLDDLTPASMYEILEHMVDDRAKYIGEDILFLEPGYTIHTGAEPTVGT